MRSSCAYRTFNIIPFLVRIRRSKPLIQVMPLIGKKIRIASTLFLLLSGVPLWLVTEAMTAEIVQAYTTRVDLSIDGLLGDNYESLVQRAEAAARAAAQRSFDQDILVTDVSIIVSVQNYGAIAPVLELAVSRPQWRTRPDPQRWATYFKTARSLLFLQKNSTTQTSTSTQPLTPLPKAPQQPMNVPPPAPVPKPFTPPK